MKDFTIKKKQYSDVILIPSFEDRFSFLKLDGVVCETTFGGFRWLNQELYRSPEWKRIRRKIIIRDEGRDLAHPDRLITGNILIHHINPITIDDIKRRSSKVFDPENLICVSYQTHMAIHYGDSNHLIQDYKERTKNDTCPWR